MKRIFIKICLTILISIFMTTSLSAYAENKSKVSYDEAKIVFEIDLDSWTEEEVKDDSTYIDKMYTSDCGELSLGVYNIYSYLTAEENMGLSSSQYNYRNLINSEESAQVFAEALINEYKQSFEIINERWEYKDFGINYVNIKGTIIKDNERVNFEQYFTINNGYGIVIQKTEKQRQDIIFICQQSLESIAKTATVTDYAYDSYGFNSISLIVDFIITLIGFMIYPFIRIKIMKHSYTAKAAKKMILLNSIIVGVIFLLIISILSMYTPYSPSAAWSAGPAFIYYIINYEIWVRKIKEKENNSNSNKETENKNKIEKKQDEKQDNNSNSKKTLNEIKELETKDTSTNTDVDKKYSDLNKLKKLLDKEIITKEEFENEKKKVLNK